ncbi:MAG: hypothetical protein Q7I96_03140 [Methanobacteriaceae archaeon]|nr:hypothetical protein [Methanobacteriaceae archaeon]
MYEVGKTTKQANFRKILANFSLFQDIFNIIKNNLKIKYNRPGFKSSPIQINLFAH